MVTVTDNIPGNYTWYYMNDLQVGEFCAFNGKNVYEECNADMKSIVEKPVTVTPNYRLQTGGSTLRHNSTTYSEGQLEITYYIGGNSREDAYYNYHKLLRMAEHTVITTSEDGYEYDAILQAFTVSETNVYYYLEVMLQFAAVKRFPLVSYLLPDRPGRLLNIGTATSGLRFIVSPKRSLQSVKVGDVTIKNLVASQSVTVDGIEGRVTGVGGVNRFPDTDLIDFPKIQPGLNLIEVSDSDVTVRCEWYPTFLM